MTFPSNQQYIDQRDKIVKLENQLSHLQQERQRMEVEYSKIPTSSATVNSAALRKRREELEGDIDMTYRTINMVKQKLRDLKAL